MHLASPWRPWVAHQSGPMFERLASAIAEDIVAGKIPRGARLPAHRDLAYKLGLSVGTVTKAYTILARRGLAKGEHGRGMFAADNLCRDEDLVDFSLNVPPQVIGSKLLSTTFIALSHAPDALAFNSYGPVIGHVEHRAAFARWLSNHTFQPPTDRLVLCGGAQHALALALTVLRPFYNLVITEAVTYPGFLDLCRKEKIQTIGVGMDHEGLCPEQLELAIREAKTAGGTPVIYVTPTAQNPSGCSMGLVRRRVLARLARKYGSFVIEDDVYSVLGDPNLPKICELLPDQTFYVNSVSKSLSPGLRLGVLLAPERFLNSLTFELNRMGLGVAPLPSMILMQWLSDGTAEVVTSALKRETEVRWNLAAEILGPFVQQQNQPCYHAWLPMQLHVAGEFVREAATRRLVITPPNSLMAEQGEKLSGVRLCLGNPSVSSLRPALSAIRQILEEMNQTVRR